MNPAFVQQIRADATGFNNTLTSSAFGSATTSGNTIVVGVFVEKAYTDVTKVTDNVGNPYILVTGSSFSTTVGIAVYMCQKITGNASHTVTVTDTGSDIEGFIAMEISGLVPTGQVLDITQPANAAAVTGSTITAASTILTANPNDILIMYANVNGADTGTWTAGSLGGSTGQNLSSNNNTALVSAYASETQVVSSTGVYSGSLGYTASANNCSLLIALSNFTISRRILSYNRINNSGSRPYPFSPGLAR